ncbi:unnamed protein product [Chironomus riparius]|uniref:Uncharacterized protein n=1 Tax=Chironomus riparius TaxID=315576 RepID=A0A9N9S930_9DIPT|nr:unnamed protein product [Chironomus riparius]
MLRLLAIALLIASVASQSRDANEIYEEERLFNQYLRRYGLDVPQDADLKRWKANVVAKFKEIEEHNSAFRKGEELFEQEVNHFSHLSDEEFDNTLIKYERKGDEKEKIVDPVKAEDTKDLPEYFNWVDKGVVHGIQNQGGCGSCYAFAAIAAIECHACLYNNICDKLSEQEALECAIGGCKGGYDRFIYSYTQEKTGATYSNYTYQQKPVNSCDDTKSRPRVPGTKVKEWIRMPNDVETIRYYLYNKGPMTIVFDVYENFPKYKRGIYSKAKGKIKGSHYVLLVGWGTEKGVDYWIYKNQWGTTFGEQGYFRVIRGKDVANIESYGPTYPILESI